MDMSYSKNPNLPKVRAESVKMVRAGHSTGTVARHFGFTQGTTVKWNKKVPPNFYQYRVIPTESSRPKHHPRELNDEIGEVFPDYKEWLESTLDTIEALGHTVFCALRADQYKINNKDPAAAFSIDMKHIEESGVLIALLNDKLSAGVQTEIGAAVALRKKVLLAHLADHELSYFNAAMVKAGVVKEVELPLSNEGLQAMLKQQN